VTWGNNDVSVDFFIWNALPDSPPSCFDFQPHGSISPETLLENRTISDEYSSVPAAKIVQLISSRREESMIDFMGIALSVKSL